MRNLLVRAEEQYLRNQQLQYTIPLKVEEDDDENDDHFKDQLNSMRTMEIAIDQHLHFQNEGDSARTMEDEEERPVHVDNEKYSESYFALRREQQLLRFQECGVHIMPPVIEEDEDEDEDEHGDDANFQDQLNSVRTIEMEKEQPPHFRNEGSSVRNLKVRA
ncbi:uncharacterized protein LOC117282315 [Cryptotermes secundus]|uniref:uncharacterized protein LOC117282315 n=1 Tax=Cryptotermes secundus TaxID=105785 RepID=UPI001454C394|nr:uncharacterized protein LOC117282315 [Cryptotermes secundus]